MNLHPPHLPPLPKPPSAHLLHVPKPPQPKALPNLRPPHQQKVPKPPHVQREAKRILALHAVLSKPIKKSYHQLGLSRGVKPPGQSNQRRHDLQNRIAQKEVAQLNRSRGLKDDPNQPPPRPFPQENLNL